MPFAGSGVEVPVGAATPEDGEVSEGKTEDAAVGEEKATVTVGVGPAGGTVPVPHAVPVPVPQAGLVPVLHAVPVSVPAGPDMPADGDATSVGNTGFATGLEWV